MTVGFGQICYGYIFKEHFLLICGYDKNLYFIGSFYGSSLAIYLNIGYGYYCCSFFG